MSRARIIDVHACDDVAHVITVATRRVDSHAAYRREPCAECPWRKDAPIGAFPAEAYRHSARTCYDMAATTFACHMSGRTNPATCAGFLLSAGAQHNMLVRIAAMNGKLDLRAVKSRVALYSTYQQMAIANGVAVDDPCLRACRS